MEMNSEIAETAPYIMSYCVNCDLEFEHEGACEWEQDCECEDDCDCVVRDDSTEPYETDGWADSNALAGIGWGDDEDY
jgi:hypothetical protein